MSLPLFCRCFAAVLAELVPALAELVPVLAFSPYYSAERHSCLIWPARALLGHAYGAALPVPYMLCRRMSRTATPPAPVHVPYMHHTARAFCTFGLPFKPSGLDMRLLWES